MKKVVLFSLVGLLIVSLFASCSPFSEKTMSLKQDTKSGDFKVKDLSRIDISTIKDSLGTPGSIVYHYYEKEIQRTEYVYDNPTFTVYGYSVESLTYSFPSSISGCYVVITTIPQDYDQFVTTLFSDGAEKSSGSDLYKFNKYNALVLKGEENHDVLIDFMDSPKARTISESTLRSTMNSCRYVNGPFSITVEKLVNKSVDNYKVVFLDAEESEKKGYLSKSDINNLDENDRIWYTAEISGYVKQNPDIEYMTTYKDLAIRVDMLFDSNHTLLNYDVRLCKEAETSALIIMSRSY